MEKHYLDYIQHAIKTYWNEPAFTDYDTGFSLSYGGLATQVAHWHKVFEALGLQKGDKVAICGRNTSYWAVAFMAVTTYQAVAVSILSDFPAESIHGLVNHSDARFFFVGDLVWKKLKREEMPALEAIVCLNTQADLLYATSQEFANYYAQREFWFNKAYPNGFSLDDVNYPTNNMDQLALINYTSGTTSAPKGVMLSYRNLSSNVQYGQDNIPNFPGWTVVSMLPLAHMFGLMFECLYQLAGGTHIYFLGKSPSPAVLFKALHEVRPYMVLTVPLVIEKIFKNAIFPTIHKPIMRVLWYLPGVNLLLRKKVNQKLMQAFGGNLSYLIVGGAPLNHQVENCLHQIKFPYTIGYGMTECAPILCYEHWKQFKKRSCGKAVHRMQVRVNSQNPHKQAGEILVKGSNVMMGYYKNPEATAEVLSQDGWMRTGDLGTIDSQGNVFLRGRNKSMILGPSGQNIYPEEIEDKLNNLQYVIESLVVERGGKLVALVFPDYKSLQNEHLTFDKGLKDLLIMRLNRLLPPFCRIAEIVEVDKEFEKTPKRSIKRFLYR